MIERALSVLHKAASMAAKLPIQLYRLMLKPLFGWPCRHLPTCSEYALEAIDRNGAWRGLWLTVSRLSRCRPGGTAGYDAVPDIATERHPFTPWRYGRWTSRNETSRTETARDGTTPHRH